ncbi:MAG: FAD-dependent monooxygenase [Candidatus Bipolaricaulia bacterium]
MPTNAIQGLNVGIVGDSIGGCTAAIELLRAGCDVTILERSTGALKDRGVGIGMPLSLVETLKACDLVEADMPHFPTRKRPFVTRYDEGDEDRRYLGRVIWEQPAATALTNWDVLYRNLRRRVPHYRHGRICLIGDASTVVRPNAGIGAVKVITNAVALANALITHESVDAALGVWDDEQTAAGDEFVTLGQTLGKIMVQ